MASYPARKTRKSRKRPAGVQTGGQMLKKKKKKLGYGKLEN